MTTVHKRYDIRILRKECISLAHCGYDVTLLVNDHLPDEIFEGVQIRSTHWVPKNKIERIFMAPYKLLNYALSTDADIYHYHDPEGSAGTHEKGRHLPWFYPVSDLPAVSDQNQGPPPFGL